MWGFSLVTEDEEGIKIVGVENRKLKLFRVDTVNPRDVCLYYKETDSVMEILRFWSESGFHKYRITEEIMEADLEILKVEIDLEKNVLYLL